MTPVAEFAAAAELVDSYDPAFMPQDIARALAIAFRDAAHEIETNVNMRVPRGLPVVPVSGNLLDLARLINGSAK
jgi:hypothetical protein